MATSTAMDLHAIVSNIIFFMWRGRLLLYIIFGRKLRPTFCSPEKTRCCRLIVLADPTGAAIKAKAPALRSFAAAA